MKRDCGCDWPSYGEATDSDTQRIQIEDGKTGGGRLEAICYPAQVSKHVIVRCVKRLSLVLSTISCVRVVFTCVMHTTHRLPMLVYVHTKRYPLHAASMDSNVAAVNQLVIITCALS